jgi:hypothetical protein
MDFHDALSTGFPARRDDEPDDLRDDIVDELADHLACAFRRELLRGADGATARRHVLEKFGDPAAVARRLWLDAMWGRIMTKRILVVCCVVLAALSLGMALVLWNQSVHAQRMLLREMAAAEAARREAEVARQQMLARLASGSKPTDKRGDSETKSTILRLTEERTDGPPAVNVLVELDKLGEGRSKEIWRTSDSGGMADFGPLQPGDYEFLIQRASPRGTFRTRASFTLGPGAQAVKQVVCPKVPPEQVPIRVYLKLPADLMKQDLIVSAFFVSESKQIEGGWQWDYRLQRSLFCHGGPANDLTEIRENHISENGGPGRGAPYLEIAQADILSLGKLGDPVGFEPTTYQLMSLYVVRKRPPTSANGNPLRFGIVASSHPPSQTGMGLVTTPVPEQFWKGKAATFEARRGQADEWTIRIPDELVKAVQEKLKAEEATKK